MRTFFFILLIIYGSRSNAQELFTYTEPASNMAAKSIGFRATNMLMKEFTGRNKYQLNMELMWGVSRNLMIHADLFFSDKSKTVDISDEKFGLKGAQLYVKYRLYSEDEVHSHFRVAAFVRGSYSNVHIHQPAIDFFGHNSGFEGGVVATKLINKVALSSSVSFLHATDNGERKFLYGDKNRNAFGYSASVGKLMLPKEYVDYNQTNLNMMVEFLGQTNLGTRQGFIDLAPSLQLIILSRMRVDLGYRFQLAGNIFRTAEQGVLLRLEYNLFNAYK
jgi:hypothetical protein